MSEDRREIEEHESKDAPGRREFLARMAALGGGALVAASALTQGAPAEAAGMKFLGSASAVSKFATTFDLVKEVDKSSPKLASSMKQAMAAQGLSPTDKVAALHILFGCQANPQDQELGLKISEMFHFTIVGLATAAGGEKNLAKFTPTLLTDGWLCGIGCTTDGWGCGGDCKSEEGGTIGEWCGHGCNQTPEQFYAVVDPEGLVISPEEFMKMNLIDLDAALQNAAQAYTQVFGD